MPIAYALSWRIASQLFPFFFNSRQGSLIDDLDDNYDQDSEAKAIESFLHGVRSAPNKDKLAFFSARQR